MAKENSNIKEKTRSGLKEPGKYHVIFHNDDFTPMEFVVMLLIQIFFKNYTEAEQLMLKVHLEGKAIVGTYSYDIAITKVNKAINLSRANGFPLHITISPE